MVLTMLEADVDAARWHDLTAAYAEALNDPEPRIVETYLLQDARTPSHWRILTLWVSAEALEAMRSEGPPRGPRIFRAAGAEPVLTIHHVRGSRPAASR